MISSATREPVQALEGRRLLSTVLNGSILTLNGSGGVDSFVVTKSGTNVSVVENGGAAKLFAISSVTRIDASLGNGNDTINIGNSLSIPASVNGGDGNDGIITGGGNDTVDGGTGNDYIEGRDGQDTVSYVGRTSPVAAYLDPSYSPSTRQVSVVGAGGATQDGVSTESDSYYAVEIIQGGSGDDQLSIRGGEDVSNDAEESPPTPIPLFIYGNGGDDHLVASGIGSGPWSHALAPAFADGGADDDTLLARSSVGGFTHSNATDTTLAGGEGDDEFDLTSNDDWAAVIPGSGIDTVLFDQVAGSGYTMPSGLERLYVYSSPGPILGNDEANVIYAYSDDLVDAKGGDDEIHLGGASQSVLGGSGNDTITGELRYRELLYVDAGDGNDIVDVYAEGGTILGGDGNDTLRTAGQDIYSDGGDGNDTFVLDGAQDDSRDSDQTVVSGSGNDSLYVLDYDAIPGSSLPIAHLVGPETFDLISIGEGVSVVVEPGSTPEANVLRVRELLIRNVFNDPAGRLDLNGNPMIVSQVGYYGSNVASTPQYLQALVKAGRDGTAFGNPGGIDSSVVDATPGMAIGYARADELFTSFPATFAGQSVAPTEYIVRVTRAGDVNLDRKVDFGDLVILAQNYGKTGRTYAQGNVSLSNDGTVDFEDLVILAQNYGGSVSAIVAPSRATVASGVVDLAGGTKSRPADVRAKMV